MYAYWYMHFIVTHCWACMFATWFFLFVVLRQDNSSSLHYIFLDMALRQLVKSWVVTTAQSQASLSHELHLSHMPERATSLTDSQVTHAHTLFSHVSCTITSLTQSRTSHSHKPHTVTSLTQSRAMYPSLLPQLYSPELCTLVCYLSFSYVCLLSLVFFCLFMVTKHIFTFTGVYCCVFLNYKLNKNIPFSAFHLEYFVNSLWIITRACHF